MYNFLDYKGLHLTTLPFTGRPVLSGFYILPETYREFLQQNELDRKIAVIIADSDLSVPEQLQVCGTRIRQLIMEHDMPDAIKTAILPAYWRLFTLPASGKLYVEVRSSIMIENHLPVPFVGQFQCIDSIFGESALLCAIKRCWASLWADSAIAYRHTYQLDHASATVAVLVQQKMPPEISGMLFSSYAFTDKRLENTPDRV